MVEVLVEYDYIAKEPDELTIRKGDIIKDVNIKTGGWWEGVLHDKKGMFPDNFVKIIDKETSSVVLRNRKDSARIRQCRVVFSYKQDHEDELDLNVGDIIDILGEEEEGWWRGILKGKEGVFPSNFVEEITPVVSKPRPSSRDDLGVHHSSDTVNSRTPNLSTKHTKIFCEVKYPYKAENSDELTLKEGDIITLISKDGEDIGWWKGELNGQIGVFPDNFVVVLPANDERVLAKEDKKPVKSSPESGLTKQVSLASQRKSLELKSDKFEQALKNVDALDGVSTKSSPPVPGKKPTIAIKKSPSGTGFISGIKKKIAEMTDVADGGCASKTAAAIPKSEATINEQQNPDNAFDQVERRPLLADVRATRPKGPGRRPPSVVYKEGEPGILNGNLDHVNLDILAESISNVPVDGESEVKPKLREWEKHKAPWLEEMKMNQAKRTSTSPGPEHKLKLTPVDKGTSEPDEPKSTKTSPYEKESSPVDMSKSMSSLSGKLKTPPNELEKVQMRTNKPKLPVPARPQTVHNMNSNPEVQQQQQQQPHPQQPYPQQPYPQQPHPQSQPQQQKLSLQPSTVSPVFTTRSPSPMQKPIISEKPAELKPNEHQDSPITYKQYTELLDRIQKLEVLIEKQNEVYTAKIEELRGKLQIESDLRMMLQAELERVSQYITQV